MYKIIQDLNKNKGIMIIMISHDLKSAKKYSDYIWEIKNGKGDAAIAIFSVVNPSPEFAEAVNFRGVPEQNDKIHFGLPETKSPLSEQTIRDVKLIEGEPSIYLTPRTDGQQYKGEILHVDKEQGYCVQLSGKHSLFVLSLEKLERTPEVGENLKLSYPHDEGRKAAITIQDAQTRTRCRK